MKILNGFLIIDEHIPKMNQAHPKRSQAKRNPTYFLFGESKSNIEMF